MSRNVFVIICVTAGKQEKISDEITHHLNASGIRHKIVKVKIPTEIPRVLKGVRLGSYDAVAVYGGDGSIIQAVKKLSGGRTPLLILPGGTANVLARYFNMPDEINACLDLISTNVHVIERADLASIDDEPFVLDMHTGLWTDAIISTPRRLKRRVGEAAYGISALKQLRSAKKDTYTFSIDDKSEESHDAFTFLVANQGNHNAFGLPLYPYEHAPGMVQLALFKDLRFSRLLLWFLWKLLTGQHLQNVITVKRAHTLKISRAPKQMLVDDAKKTFRPPVIVRGGAYAVRLITPPQGTNRPFHKVLYHRIKIRSHVHVQRIKTMFFNYTPELKYSHVAPHIYLGGKYPAKAYKVFEEWGVTGIVSMRTSESPPAPVGINLLRLPTQDWTPPSIGDLKKGVDFIQHHVRQNGSVYIHCQLGEGRGPTMAAAYLIAKGLSADEAVAQLTKHRPFVRPNDKQMKRLAEWQQHLARKS